MANVFINVFLF